MTNPESEIICPWCGRQTQIIWIHGHGQCIFCRVNIDECCRGEQCSDLTKTESDEEEDTD